MSKYSLEFARVLGRVHGRLSEPKRRHLELAFDEAEKTDFGDMPSKIVGYLTPRLSKAELQAIVEAIQEVMDRDLAEDEPPDFPGKPLTGGGKAGERQNSFVGPGNSNGRAAEKNPGTFSESASNPAGTSSRGFHGASNSSTRAAEHNRLEALSMDSRRRAAFRASYGRHFPDVKIALDDNYGKQPAPKGLSHRAAKSASISDYEAQFGGVAKKV